MLTHTGETELCGFKIFLKFTFQETCLQTEEKNDSTLKSVDVCFVLNSSLKVLIKKNAQKQPFH